MTTPGAHASLPRPFGCVVHEAADALPISTVRAADFETWIAGLTEAQAAFVRRNGFAAAANTSVLLPGPAGPERAIVGLGSSSTLHQAFGHLGQALPAGSVWRLDDAIGERAEALLGFCLGAYRNGLVKTNPPQGPLLLVPDDAAAPAALSAARAVWLVRDLVNMPANLLGPQELAVAARMLLSDPAHGGSARAVIETVTGADLESRYPALAAVARGSSRPGAVVVARWQGSAAPADARLISICGKGVCFDTGGYDLKTADGMLRMKKDMGGAAVSIGLARMIMDADLPVRLDVRLGCVENALHGDAMRPLDVLRTRRGLSVEVGNTDAEGRLVLCDLLAEASDAAPDLLLDFATLTGAARTALGPDVAVMFGNDDETCASFAKSGGLVHDPVWRLPLWDGYDYWLDCDTGDVSNVSTRSHAGAIIAALFLRKFLAPGVRWAHFDVYCWNDHAGSGKPAGGEANAMRCVFHAIAHAVKDEGKMFSSSSPFEV